VIVTITERTSNDYSLDHINVNDGTANPAQDVTGTRTVTFEAMHGAIITYYNNALINVCKQGTSATFQYQVGVSNAYQPLSLANGECRLIATIPPTNKDDVIVTVRENSSTSYTFDHAVLQQGNTAPQTFTVPTVGGFEGAHGATITFYNTPVVSFGCTYTQGYYKNKGKGLLPSGNFYKSGQTYLQVLETAPKGGNAYYILAHQYIAASINAKTASVPTSVQAALTASAIYFATATPSNPYFGIYTQSYLTSLADILDQYNSGQLGPGHCGGEDGEE
jgi:hypothetical protein